MKILAHFMTEFSWNYTLGLNVHSAYRSPVQCHTILEWSVNNTWMPPIIFSTILVVPSCWYDRLDVSLGPVASLVDIRFAVFNILLTVRSRLSHNLLRVYTAGKWWFSNDKFTLKRSFRLDPQQTDDWRLDLLLDVCCMNRSLENDCKSAPLYFVNT